MSQKSFAEQDEWRGAGSIWSGKDVYRAAKLPTEEWLADCKESRTSSTELMERILRPSNLIRAFKRVKRNKGSGGIDGMGLSELEEWFGSHYKELIETLRKGTYHPQALRGVKIPKPKGGYRQLGIPTLKDRLVQQAIHQVLSPLYEQTFSTQSYGFRVGKNAHQALEQAGEYVELGKHYIVDIDLAKFFDEVNHARLMWLLSTRIGDKVLLKLIHRILKAGLLEGGLSTQRIKGTPQGGPLSPLLSNIVLDELDKELERRGHKFVRYADDVIILVGSRKSAERVQRSITEYIEGHLHLRVNRAKSRLMRSWEVNYLGHGIKREGKLQLSQESEKRLKTKLRILTRRNRGRSLDQIIKEVNQLMLGWLYYFRYASMKGKMRAIWRWLKHRLRCYRLKQCKRALGISRFLRKLGVPNDRSWTTAASSCGWWRKSATPAIHEGMNNIWFKQQGLLNIELAYSKLYVQRNRRDTRVRPVV